MGVEVEGRQPRICPKCGTQMKLRSMGPSRNPQWRCQSCHLLALKTKYKESRNAAITRYSKTEKCKRNNQRRAVSECGVPSITSMYSRRSEKHAFQARQLWGPVDDDVLMSGNYTEGELVLLLGRSIRAIQARKRRIRDENKTHENKYSATRAMED